MEKEILESISRLQKIGNELGIEQTEHDSKEVPENAFDYTERLLFGSIQDVKEMISKRDKESLVCSNRRTVIEMNASIYKKLKETVSMYADLQNVFEKAKKIRYGKHKLTDKEVSQKEEVLMVLLAQLKRLEELASENHATERFVDVPYHDQTIPILTVLPESPQPFQSDKMDVEEAIQEVEADLTEHQKASLQIYEKNRLEIDTLLDSMSEGLSELKNQAVLMGDEIEKQNQMLRELDDAVDDAANTIQQERQTLQRHTKQRNMNCSMYLCCTILILIVVIVILNILRTAF